MKLLTLTFLLFCMLSNSFAQSLSNDTLHWAEHKVLTWADFKGEDIDVPGLAGQCSMLVAANYKKAHFMLPTSASVATVFDRKNSWITKVNQTDQSLRYYQVLFDLYEVYARMLRRDFSQTKFGSDPNRIFQEKYNAVLTALSDRSKLFYKETKLGTDSDALNTWFTIVKQELKELDKFRKSK